MIWISIPLTTCRLKIDGKARGVCVCLCDGNVQSNVAIGTTGIVAISHVVILRSLMVSFLRFFFPFVCSKSSYRTDQTCNSIQASSQGHGRFGHLQNAREKD
jgi:hypothetical protein